MGLPASAPLPSLRDELDRKTFETVEWLVVSLKNKSISEAQFKTAIDAVFMAVAGLASRDFVDLVTSVSMAEKYTPAQLRRVLVKGTTATRFVWAYGDLKVTCDKLEEGRPVKELHFEGDTPAQCIAWIDDMADRLKKAGWAEL